MFEVLRAVVFGVGVFLLAGRLSGLFAWSRREQQADDADWDLIEAECPLCGSVWADDHCAACGLDVRAERFQP